MLDDAIRQRIEDAWRATNRDMKTLSRQSGRGDTFLRDLIERGRSPSVENFIALAHALGEEPSYLLSGIRADDDERQVPLVSWVSAGSMIRSEGVVPAQIESYVPVSNLGRGDWIALQVTGDSMDRVAPDGSIIIVNRAEDALINDRFYVFAMEGGEATFKRWRREPQPMLRPYSTNLDHLAIPASAEDIYVVGRVRKVLTDL